ncbi:MAG TPA: SusD/RagB family nutrient-binding outer membrane lipoprotein, partial [Puia sp.]
MRSTIQIRHFLLSFLLLAGASSCDKDFVSVNTNPTQPTSLDPGYLFATGEVNVSIPTFYYQSPLAQQIIHPFTGVAEGGNHNVQFDNNASTTFDYLYNGTGNGATVTGNTTQVNGPVALLNAVIAQTKGGATRSNLYNMARIMRAYCFMILVDTYGDVPYSQAGQAYLAQINLPKYDAQQDIYTDLVNELTQATAALDAGKATEANDALYKGNISQWKKLGNSLLVRIGMRYSKADAAKAQQIVSAAYAAGTMQSNADNAMITFSATFPSPTGNWFQGTERANVYLAKPFVDSLQRTHDPRLGVIAVKYTNPGGSLSGGGVGTEDTVQANQLGMPLGYNEATISTAPGFPGKATTGWKYSQLNRRTVVKIDEPEFLVTYAQTQLLLAEAAQRGWISAPVATLYNAGVRAHMDQMAKYDPSATIPTAAQDAYMAANPFNPGDALQQINTQYWI